MPSLPRVESIPCPTCHAKELKLREDGNGAECAACGQWVVFDDGPGQTGKRRNYTPDRGMKKLATGAPTPPATASPAMPRAVSRFPKNPPDAPRSAAPATGEIPHLAHANLPPLKPPSDLAAPASQPHGHFGPMPIHQDPKEPKPIIIPSQALETVTRAGCYRRFIVLVVLALMGAATFWIIRHHQRSLEAAAVVPEKKVVSHPLLDNTTMANPGDAEVAEARAFLQEKVFPVQSWEQLVPHVRLPETVEPLMREYHATVPFAPLEGVTVTESRTAQNSAGRFAIFLLSSVDYPVAMIELGANGPKLDWEMLVSYPMRAWRQFLQDRPATGVDLAVSITRGYMREDYLTAEEKSRPGRLIGAWIGMPGSDVRLFATADLESALGRWISTTVPWEHENQSILMRAGLAFHPKHRAYPARVTITSQPVSGWNRPKPKEVFPEGEEL